MYIRINLKVKKSINFFDILKGLVKLPAITDIAPIVATDDMGLTYIRKRILIDMLKSEGKV